MLEPSDFSRQTCADIPAEYAFQIKAQVDAYRRIIRGMEIPLETNIAAMGKLRRIVKPMYGALVARGLPDDDELCPYQRPSLQSSASSRFDPRLLPRFAPDHCFTTDDVIMDGEKELSAPELEERLQLAKAHHARLNATVDAKRDGNDNAGEEQPRIDQRLAQERAAVMKRLRNIGKQLETEKNEPTTQSKPAAEMTNPRKHDKPLVMIKDSVGRERAAVPISVVSKSKDEPSFQEILAERQKRVANRVKARRDEIAEVLQSAPEYITQILTMEQKGLKLVGLQLRVKRHVMESMQKMLTRRGISDLSLKKISKMKRATREHKFANSVMRYNSYGNASGVEAGHRAHQEAQRRNRQRNVMQNLMNHAQDYRNFLHSRLQLKKRLLKDLERYFRDRSREEERKKKKEQMERLRALRNNNEDEYLELLKTTKNKRLIQLLKQTDEYLVQIGAQVERQKQSAREADEILEVTGEAGKEDTKAKDDESMRDNVDEEAEDELSQLKKRRNDYYTITHTISEKVEQPRCLVGGTLKPYQVDGLEWLVSLYNNNLNGILADEMGLGKTIQTLSLIAYLMERKKVSGPYLVIVPLSVISNWVRELNIWAPSIVKVVYKGDPATRKNIQQTQMQGDSYNILLTTYEFVVKDRNVLGRIRWKYIIMDEGHRMKNADCKLALTLGAKYTSRNRLLLTGTPLQNNMTELWALLNFLLPTIFSSAETFETWFNAPFQASALGDSAELNEEENLLIISRLHQVLRPFMLRRLKTDVESQLPDKVEIIFRCEMSIWQRVLYRQMRRRIGIAAGSGSGSVRSFNNMVMQLKKVCNHPYLFYQDEELISLPMNFLMRAAGKFELLDHCLRKLKRAGHRVLIFSQMTAALDYLEYFLSSIGMKYLRLDGTTKADDRQVMLEMFNAANSDYFCFLLSTRAGGLGLNLQTADTVIIFDSDWNPMMDLQAQDRAHRIGQTKEVRVFRLICSGSIEVKILERANRKLQIDAQVIQAGQFNNKSSDNDRQEMLKDILRQQAGDDIGKQDVTSLAEINKKLARSEEEIELFEEMDAEVEAEWNGKPRLLVDESELPEWVLQPEKEEKEKRQSEGEFNIELGRGRRKRKEVFYDDNLTEKEWTAAMEQEGDITEAVKKKRRRLSVPQTSPTETSSEDAIRRQSSAVDSSEREVGRIPPLKIPAHLITGSMKDSSEDVDMESNGRKSEDHDTVFASELEPFIDPEFQKPPRPKRKRGRPRKDSRRRGR